MRTPKLFISFNQGIEVEQSTALRLQTISSLYNAQVYLPDRLGSNQLKESTKQRIRDSQVFVMFSTHGISPQVKQEVEYALLHNKKVVIFYHKDYGKKVSFENVNRNMVLEIPYDPQNDNPADLLQNVFAHGGFLSQSNEEPTTAEQSQNNALGALVAVGLGLFLLWALSDDNEPKKKNRRR